MSRVARSARCHKLCVRHSGMATAICELCRREAECHVVSEDCIGLQLLAEETWSGLTIHWEVPADRIHDSRWSVPWLCVLTSLARKK